MSQIFIKQSGYVPTGAEKLTPSFDSGGGAGLPVGPDGANNINLLGASGIITTGNVATNTITISEENKYSGTTTTSGLETKIVITLPSTNDTVTHFDCIIAGRATPIAPGATVGFGGYISASFITGGGVATQINTTDFVIDSFITTTCTFTCAGSGTDILIRVTGDASYNISWSAQAVYVKTS
jgi:hypothetical protein